MARKFQRRRHEDWNDNYELYRNKVQTNRLTQRQAVNIPLMKETIKTLLSKIDEPPSIDFKELGGNLEKEIFLQEMWNTASDEMNLEGVDIQDKKTVLLYGRGFLKLNYSQDKFMINALDIYDVVVDPLTDPLDLETARFVIHQNIFRSLRDVLADERYSETAKKKLKTYLSTTDAIIQDQANKDELDRKQERLETIGVNSDDFDRFAAGDVLLNLTEHYTYFWDSKQKKNIRHVVIYANDAVELMDETLEDLIGVNFLPFITWGEDVETQDFWSDGPADLVRTPNKVLNVWFSQMVENRTLKNFQMYWYDSSNPDFQPQTFTPGPGRQIPAPGNPRETIMPMDVSGLDDTMNQIDFLIRLIERGTSATAIEKGVSEKKQITLGEVETLVGKAMERTMTMAKFYRRARKELAQKWFEILDANDNQTRTLYKTSAKGGIWAKEIKPSDWRSEKGYRIMAKSTSEQETEKTSGLQKLLAMRQQFPNNMALQKIVQRRALELLDLTPEEIREVEEEEKKMAEAIAQQPQVGAEENQAVEGITNGLNELAQLTANV